MMAAGRVQQFLLSSLLLVLIFGLQATAQQLDPPGTPPAQATGTVENGEIINAASADVLGSGVTAASTTGKFCAARDLVAGRACDYPMGGS